MVLEPGSIRSKSRQGIEEPSLPQPDEALYNLSSRSFAGREIDSSTPASSASSADGCSGWGQPPRRSDPQRHRRSGCAPSTARKLSDAKSCSRGPTSGRSEMALSPPDALTRQAIPRPTMPNYGRGGSRMAEMRAIVPFLGAGSKASRQGRSCFVGGPAIRADAQEARAVANRTLRLQGTKTSLPLSQVEADPLRSMKGCRPRCFPLGGRLHASRQPLLGRRGIRAVLAIPARHRLAVQDRPGHGSASRSRSNMLSIPRCSVTASTLSTRATPRR